MFYLKNNEEFSELELRGPEKGSHKMRSTKEESDHSVLVGQSMAFGIHSECDGK